MSWAAVVAAGTGAEKFCSGEVHMRTVRVLWFGVVGYFPIGIVVKVIVFVRKGDGDEG